MPESKSKTKIQKAKVAPTTAESKPTGDLSVAMVDSKGKTAGTIALPKEYFGAKVNDVLMAQAVRVYLANQRAGSAITQTRGEVSMTSAKWYRQKGTGRARHGAKSAPIFVHGGVAHGPRKHDFSLKFSKKMKKAALASALSSKVQDGHITVISGLEALEPKTKIMSALLKTLSVSPKKHTLLVVDKSTDSAVKAARNIKNITVTPVGNMNTYMVLAHESLLFMRQAVETLEKKGAKNG